MPIIVQKKKAASLSTVLSAAKKLTAEEKQILRMRLFADDAIKEMRDFEKALKKSKKNVPKKL
ncbi:MAG: hypothetical protein WDM90_06065 [Ferruginibacter sp.]